MACDQRQVVVPRVKAWLSVVVTPLQYAVAWPGQALDYLKDYLTVQRQLVQAVHHWQDQRLLLEAQLQQVNALKLENQQLQSLLSSPMAEQQDRFLLAKVLQLATDAFNHEVMVNRGSQAGVKTGQAVLAAEGIVGQIIEVNPLAARVMLVSDSRSAVPVIDQRSQENFIVIGTGDPNSLSLMNVSSSADLQVGDRLLSSGMGGHFPAGFAVGVVTAIHPQAKSFAQIQVKPAVNLAKLQLVLIPFEVTP